MKTRAQAEHDWFHGVIGEPAGPDVGVAFRAGWDALARDTLIAWCIEQERLGRHLVALISPSEAHDGPRYAGYYCEDAPARSAGGGISA